MDMKRFGERLREQRELAGLSQTEVSQRTGIIQADLSLLERGKKRALWAGTLERLAQALGCTMDYLAGISDEPAPAKRQRTRKTAPAD
jgi:transcriptional regulator with XRE-family HTH domain